MNRTSAGLGATKISTARKVLAWCSDHPSASTQRSVKTLRSYARKQPVTLSRPRADVKMPFWKRKDSSRSEKNQKEGAKLSTDHWIDENLSVDRRLSSILLQAEAEFLCGRGVEWEWKTSKSCLKPSLKDLLHEQMALPYFIQHLESASALPYIRLWLDVENFRTSMLTLGNMTEATSKSEIICDNDSCKKAENDQAESEPACSPLCANNHKGLSSISLSLPGDKDVRRVPSAKSLQLSNSSQLWDVIGQDACLICDRYLQPSMREKVPDLPPSLAEEAIASVRCKAFGEDLDPDVFKAIQSFIFDVLQERYYPQFLTTAFFCKYQVEVLTSGCVTLKDILFDDTTLFYFMEFMDQEGDRGLVEFLLAGTNLTQQLASQELVQEEAQGDAIVLYERYFSLQSPTALGFSDSVRLALEENMCQDEGPKYDCFAIPMSIVTTVLTKHFFPNFLSSQLYYKYLTELIRVVQVQYAQLPPSTIKKPGSTSSESSEQTCSSASIRNTLLAMDTSQPGVPLSLKRSKGHSKFSFSDDPLSNNKCLWNRPLAGKLMTGQVTELGRYCTNLEPDPESKEGESRLRRMMKGLKKKKMDEEELAWRVAEMVVRDVTSVTLASPTSLFEPPPS